MKELKYATMAFLLGLGTTGSVFAAVIRIDGHEWPFARARMLNKKLSDRFRSSFQFAQFGVNATGVNSGGFSAKSADQLMRMIEKTQYDFGRPSTFSAMKLRIICGLTGASRGIITSRR